MEKQQKPDCIWLIIEITFDTLIQNKLNKWHTELKGVCSTPDTVRGLEYDDVTDVVFQEGGRRGEPCHPRPHHHHSVPLYIPVTTISRSTSS